MGLEDKAGEEHCKSIGAKFLLYKLSYRDLPYSAMPVDGESLVQRMVSEHF